MPGDEQPSTVKIIYKVVQHDGGWAYRVGETFSEAYATHDEAFTAARRAAAEHQRPGDAEAIEYEDASGHWHIEVASGRDRPDPVVEDSSG